MDSGSPVPGSGSGTILHPQSPILGGGEILPRPQGGTQMSAGLFWSYQAAEAESQGPMQDPLYDLGFSRVHTRIRGISIPDPCLLGLFVCVFGRCLLGIWGSQEGPGDIKKWVQPSTPPTATGL